MGRVLTRLLLHRPLGSTRSRTGRSRGPSPRTLPGHPPSRCCGHLTLHRAGSQQCRQSSEQCEGHRSRGRWQQSRRRPWGGGCRPEKAGRSSRRGQSPTSGGKSSHRAGPGPEGQLELPCRHRPGQCHAWSCRGRSCRDNALRLGRVLGDTA